MKKTIFFLIAFFTWSLLFGQTVNLDMLLVNNFDEKIINDPNIDYKKFKTFNIISANVLFNNKSVTLEEEQIEFIVANSTNRLNLKKVSISDSIKPDLMFVYDFRKDYQEKYIAPEKYSFPKWSQGRRTTINSNSNSCLDTYGDIHVSGNKTTTITQSGKWDVATVQRPEYTVGQFFPNFSLTIYDTSDNSKIWEWNGNCTTTREDPRFAMQLLMLHLCLKVPMGSYEDPDFFVNNDGFTGLDCYHFNTNGIGFYPIIMGIRDNSPGKVYKFKIYDIILSMNGESTLNKSQDQFSEMCRGNAGKKIDYVIERKGRQIKKTLVKQKRE